ncbi:hypothetical protein LCGC14_1328710 [marine sediment metagenome]|uniref:ATP-grasp fold RimK-type domain-containing protein n=1 Tax=marine sediment metagenome TaxID=412755 RepID=A0A0F9KHW4_9ZZZZ
MSIYIKSGRIWGKSRRLLVDALGEHYTEHNPSLIFDLRKPSNYVMVDKVIMNKKLDELGIIHPKTYYHPFEDLPNTNEECVIKHKYGSQGNHLIFTTFDQISKDELCDRYVQQYVPFKAEYRIGVDWMRVLGIREKISNDSSRTHKIKNSRTCFYITREIPQLHMFAWKVAQLFEVEFTGIDIGLWNDQFIVIELNSSPALGEYWAKLLAQDLIIKLVEK